MSPSNALQMCHSMGGRNHFGEATTHPPAISLASFHLTPLDHAIVFLFHCLHVPLLLPFTSPCPTTDEALAFPVKYPILLHVHGLHHVHHAKNSSSRRRRARNESVRTFFLCSLKWDSHTPSIILLLHGPCVFSSAILIRFAVPPLVSTTRKSRKQRGISSVCVSPSSLSFFSVTRRNRRRV